MVCLKSDTCLEVSSRQQNNDMEFPKHVQTPKVILDINIKAGNHESSVCCECEDIQRRSTLKRKKSDVTLGEEDCGCSIWSGESLQVQVQLQTPEPGNL